MKHPGGLKLVCVISLEAHSDAWHLAASARGWAPTEGDEVPQLP